MRMRVLLLFLIAALVPACAATISFVLGSSTFGSSEPWGNSLPLTGLTAMSYSGQEINTASGVSGFWITELDFTASSEQAGYAVSTTMSLLTTSGELTGTSVPTGGQTVFQGTETLSGTTLAFVFATPYYWDGSNSDFLVIVDNISSKVGATGSFRAGLSGVDQLMIDGSSPDPVSLLMTVHGTTQAPVPEPTTLLPLAAALVAGFFAIRRRT